MCCCNSLCSTQLFLHKRVHVTAGVSSQMSCVALVLRKADDGMRMTIVYEILEVKKTNEPDVAT